MGTSPAWCVVAAAVSVAFAILPAPCASARAWQEVPEGPGVPTDPNEGAPASRNEEAPAAATNHAPATDEKQREVIVLAVLDRGSGEDAGRAIEAFIAHLSGASVDVVVERPNVEGLREQIAWAKKAVRMHGASGVFWLDLAPGEELMLYLVEPTGESALVRTIPRDPEGPRSTFEALGAIARSITVALLEGQRIGMKRVQLPEPERSPPVPAPVVGKQAESPRTNSFHLLRLSAQYVGTTFADDVPWQSGVGLDLSVRPLPALFLGLGYAYVFESRVVDPLATLTIQRNPIALFGGFHGRFTPVVAVEVEARVVVDAVRQGVIDVAEVEPPLEAAGASTRMLVSGGASGRLLVFVYKCLALHASVGLDVVMNPFDYVVLVEGEQGLRFSPHRIRARATAGISCAFLSRPRKR